jgi:hypothetical protein
LFPKYFHLSRLGHWFFKVDLILAGALWPLELSQPLTNMNMRNFPEQYSAAGAKGQKITATCEKAVCKM